MLYPVLGTERNKTADVTRRQERFVRKILNARCVTNYNNTYTNKSHSSNKRVVFVQYYVESFEVEDYYLLTRRSVTVFGTWLRHLNVILQFINALLSL